MGRDRKKLQEDLAKLKIQFNSPIKLPTLICDFQKYFSDAFATVETKQFRDKDFKAYLFDRSDKYFEAIQLEKISWETGRIEDLIQDIRKDKYVKFDIFENGDYGEANKLLRDIYTKWNDVQLRQELCSDHVVLIKKAIMHLTSFKKVVSAFVSDNDAHPIRFKTVADSKRFIEIIVVSIDSHIDVLKSQIIELSAWMDNILSPKINMLMRADSSLRLLAKYAEWDKNYNRGCGNTSPKEFKGFGNVSI